MSNNKRNQELALVRKKIASGHAIKHTPFVRWIKCCFCGKQIEYGESIYGITIKTNVYYWCIDCHKVYLFDWDK